MADAPAALGACPRCRASASPKARYCGNCGAHLEIATGADPLIGTIVSERYRLVSLVGTNPSGAVYQAEHVGMGKVVSVKLIHVDEHRDRDLVDRFVGELRHVSGLSDLHTAALLDFGATSRFIFMVSEFFRGSDLGKMVRQGGSMLPHRALHIAAQTCRSLAEAHDSGVLHLRLKPENVFVSRTHDGDDFVKVLDYGFGRLADVQDERSLAAASRFRGTPHYMAPEQVTGAPQDGRTDLYAVAALLYWMVVGNHVFTASNPIGVLKKHLTAQPVAPSRAYPDAALPPFVDDLILDGLSKASSDRPPSVEEYRAELLRAAARL